ncbi:Metallo-dependent phosphatase-like protein [Aspergillus cavernicola]|uniref:Metallo-dependent phosphatase-like protein n=1 Tax=Aspergillus cavernicola TaxID=176166 RepID=A0ABR4HR62_9EURO
MFEKVRSIFDKPCTSFQVLSDLHLEINQQYLSFDIPVCAKHLILAGDVGRLVDYDNYRGFLQKQTDRFELVFLILGNHEFYNNTFASGLQKARQLEQEPCLNGRLVLLHQGRYDIPGSRVTVLGCTLWSKIPDEARAIVLSKIQDFKKIKDWTVDDHNGSHEADLAWLLSEMELIQSKNKTENKKRSILVMTHHAPSIQDTSSPQHANNPWSSAFATDILSQISKSSGVKAWVFGHTHYTTEFKNQGIRVVANQRGYVLPWNNLKGSKDGFDVGKVIRV